MDPQATLKEITDLCSEGPLNWQEISEYSGHLLNWLTRDGFAPKVDGESLRWILEALNTASKRIATNIDELQPEPMLKGNHS